MFPTAVVVARGASLEDPAQRAITLKFLRAFDRGLSVATSDPTIAEKALRKYTKVDDPVALQETWEYYRQYFPKSLRIDEVGVRNVLHLLDDPGAKDADPKQFVDNSLLDQIEGQKP
jgi:ABC-type nitrate/sulfonate/bicarbonate transport system substrate-binding protein